MYKFVQIAVSKDPCRFDLFSRNRKSVHITDTAFPMGNCVYSALIMLLVQRVVQTVG